MLLVLTQMWWRFENSCLVKQIDRLGWNIYRVFQPLWIFNIQSPPQLLYLSQPHDYCVYRKCYVDLPTLTWWRRESVTWNRFQNYRSPVDSSHQNARHKSFNVSFFVSMKNMLNRQSLDISIKVCDQYLSPSDEPWCYFYSTHSLVDHVAKVCQSINFNIYYIGKMRKYLDRATV